VATWMRRPTNWRGGAWIAGELACTAAAIGLSLTSSARIGTGWAWIPVWLFSQLALGVILIQWLILMHGCGHRALFANRLLNDVFGHVASVFCLVPYFSWRYIHARHHRWVGWMDKDPTTRGLAEAPPSLPVQRVMNFCWKFWIPIFSLAFGASLFWNPRRVAAVAPMPYQRRRTLFSFVFVVAVYAGAIALMGERFLNVWLVAFLCYLTIGDPLLLSQHVHLPLLKSEGEKVKPFPPAKQDRFTRTIVLPHWAAQWVFLQFTTHGPHHAYPQIAHYDIARVPFSSTHAITWSDWLVSAKRIPAVLLLYKSSDDTGISI
jgi:acyl-lipid omega-6 desaturase (Delta-12 desaturase)